MLDDLPVRELQFLESRYVLAQPLADRGNRTLHESAFRARLRKMRQHFLRRLEPVGFILHVQPVAFCHGLHVAPAQSCNLLEYLVQSLAVEPAQAVVTERFMQQHAGHVPRSFDLRGHDVDPPACKEAFRLPGGALR